MYNKIMIAFIKKLHSIYTKTFSWFRQLSLKKKLFFVGIVLIVLILALVKINQLRQPPPYTTQKVKKADIVETVNETGNIASGGIVNVYSPTNGVVTEVLVGNGTLVVKDQNLFSVQSSATQQEAQTAYANYLAARTLLNAANSNQDVLRSDMFTKWKRYLDLATNATYENGDDTPNTANRTAAEFHIVEDDWHAAEKKYKDQQTAIEQAQAAVSSTWLAYQATQNAIVKAPMDGNVSNLAITNGSAVSINSALSPQIPVLAIKKGATNEIVIPLSETDISKIKPGQSAKINVDAVNNKTYQGIVERVDAIGTKIQGIITYNVYLKILDADENIRAGMSVDAEITTKKLSNTLSVPNSAVKPYQAGKAVRIPGKKKGEIVYVPVEIGVKGKNRTQILKGLMEGQTVITTLSNEQIKRPGLFGN